MTTKAEDINATECEEDHAENIVVGNIVMLSGEITQEKTNDIIGYIIDANFPMENEIPPKNLNLLINSRGGCMESTFALISAMRASRIPVRTVALGTCASGGVMLAISGKVRFVDKYCHLMSHTLSTGYPEYAKPSDLQRWLDSVHLSKQMIVDLYMESTGMTDGAIVEHLLPLDGDRYLTAKQAIGYNLFDDYFTSFDQLRD